MYFDISPEKLISFTPIDVQRIKYYSEGIPDNRSPFVSVGLLYFDILTSDKKRYSCSFNVFVEDISQTMELPDGEYEELIILDINIDSTNDNETTLALPLLKLINRPFFKDISNLIGECIYKDAFQVKYNINNVDISVNWSVLNENNPHTKNSLK